MATASFSGTSHTLFGHEPHVLKMLEQGNRIRAEDLTTIRGLRNPICDLSPPLSQPRHVAASRIDTATLILTNRLRPPLTNHMHKSVAQGHAAVTDLFCPEKIKDVQLPHIAKHRTPAALLRKLALFLRKSKLGFKDFLNIDINSKRPRHRIASLRSAIFLEMWTLLTTLPLNGDTSTFPSPASLYSNLYPSLNGSSQPPPAPTYPRPPLLTPPLACRLSRRHPIRQLHAKHIHRSPQRHVMRSRKPILSLARSAGTGAQRREFFLAKVVTNGKHSIYLRLLKI